MSGCAARRSSGSRRTTASARALAAGDGEKTVGAARSTRDRDSILGRYSIDPDGHTTSTAYGRLAVADGELVWDR